MRVYLANLKKIVVDSEIDILPSREADEITKYNMPELRERILASRISRRKILSSILGVPTSRLEFAVCTGKPHLIGFPNCHFSVSYSNDFMALATYSSAVGVDIEKIELNSSNQDVVEALLHPNEIRNISEKMSEIDTRQFYSIWTQKEAFAKALGMGFDLEFRKFQINPQGGLVQHSLSDVNGKWYTKHKVVGTNLSLAIASQHQNQTVDLIEWHC